MTSEQFRLVAGHELICHGRSIDLHNNFLFSGLQYSDIDATASLLWHRSQGPWVAEDEPASVNIVFTDVEVLKMEPCQADLSNHAPKTVQFAGYLNAEDLDVMNGYVERKEATDDYHFIFGFEGGMAIKIGASSGYVTTGP